MTDTLIVGIDAFSKEYFEDRLVNTRKSHILFDEDTALHRHNSVGEQDIAHTGPCWTSMYTGVEPEEHGITSGGWKAEQLDYANIKTKTIFEQLDRAGISQAVYAMPATYPVPRLENGWAVSGFPSPLGTEDTYYPKHYGVKDLAQVPRNVVQIRDELPLPDGGGLRVWGPKLEEENYAAQVTELMIDMEFNRCRRFLETVSNPDIAWFGTHGVDKICHMFGLDYSNLKVSLLYETMMDVVEILYNKLKPDQLYVVSDHGFKKNKQEHNRHGVFFEHPGRSDESNDYPMINLARMLSDDFGLGMDWMGEPRDQNLYKEGDKKNIRDRLRNLGYI